MTYMSRERAAVAVFTAQNVQMLADLHRRMATAIVRDVGHLHHILLHVAELFNCEAAAIDICGMPDAKAR